MDRSSKTLVKLLKCAGPFCITIFLSAVFAAVSAVVNLRSYICVYEVTKLLINSSGDFSALDLDAMKALGIKAVYYVCIGFGLLFSMLKGESSEFIEKVQKSGEDIGNAATEYVRGIAVVKTFGQTASSFRRYQKAVKDYADFMTRYSFSMENAFSAYTTVVNVVFLFLIPSGIILYNAGNGAEKIIMTFAFFAVLIPLVASILTKLMHSSSNLMLADA